MFLSDSFTPGADPWPVFQHDPASINQY